MHKIEIHAIRKMQLVPDNRHPPGHATPKTSRLVGGSRLCRWSRMSELLGAGRRHGSDKGPHLNHLNHLDLSRFVRASIDCSWHGSCPENTFGAASSVYVQLCDALHRASRSPGGRKDLQFIKLTFRGLPHVGRHDSLGGGVSDRSSHGSEGHQGTAWYLTNPL